MSNIREARHTKASTQGYAEEQLACAAGASAALTLKESVDCSWKQHATWESEAGVRDDTKNATDVEIWCDSSITKMDVDAHLSEQEVITDAFSNNEANTQEIERVKMGLNNICIREDLATEKMVFSQESSRAVLEMGNVELIELRMHIMLTLRILRNTYLQMRKTNAARSRRDEPY